MQTEYEKCVSIKILHHNKCKVLEYNHQLMNHYLYYFTNMRSKKPWKMIKVIGDKILYYEIQIEPLCGFLLLRT